jgi:hypothetical protein
MKKGKKNTYATLTVFTLFVLSMLFLPGAFAAPPQITTTDVTAVDEDSMYSVDYNASDADLDTLTWDLDTNATFLGIDTDNGWLNGTPANDDVGTFWVNVSVSDGSEEDWSNFTLTVNNVNDDPAITTTDPAGTGIEDNQYSQTFEAEDEDPTSDTLTWSLNTDANFLSIGASTGIVSGTPDDSGVGMWFVNVTVNDGNGGSAHINYTLDISNVNDDPVITTLDNPIAFEDSLYRVDYNFTDEDPPGQGDKYVWELFTDIPADWLSIDSATGVLSGTPTNDDVGTYGVTVRISDSLGGMDTHDFDLVVTNVNDPPVITNPVEETYYWEEDLYGEIDFNATDVDAGEILTWDLIADAPWLSLDADTGILSGTPTNEEVGEWLINVTVTDDSMESDWNVFTIDVTNTNDPPTIDPVFIDEIEEDELFWYNFTAQDIDPTDDEIEWSLETNAMFLSINSLTGNLSGTPTNNDVGEWWINVTAFDGNGGFDQVNRTIRVVNVNDAPEILTESLPDATEDEFYSFIMNATDMDPTNDLISWSLENTDLVTLEIISTTGNLSFTPSNGDVGDHWAVIRATDTFGAYDEVNLSFTVMNTNDDPVIETISLPNAIEDQEYWFVLNGTDIDPTDDVLTWTINDTDAEFLFLNSATGNLTALPLNEDVGVWYVNITLDDGMGGMDWENFTIIVENVNDPPVVNRSGIVLEMEEDIGSREIDLYDVFVDRDGDLLTFDFEVNENFTVIIFDGVANITPREDFYGTESIVFSASDGINETSTSISVFVEQVNDPPQDITVDFNITYVEGGSQLVSASAEDVDGDELTYTWMSNITGEIGIGREINLSLPAGIHQVTLVVSDPSGASINETFEVTIVDRETDEEQDDDDDGFLWIMIIIIVVVILLILLILILMAMRKKSGEDQEMQTTIPEERAVSYEQTASVEEGPVPSTAQSVEQSMYEDTGAQEPPQQPQPPWQGEPGGEIPVEPAEEPGTEPAEPGYPVTEESVDTVAPPPEPQEPPSDEFMAPPEEGQSEETGSEPSATQQPMPPEPPESLEEKE